MNTYAKEYLEMMSQLKVLFVKMRNYNGSQEHMAVLNNCINKGKKMYSDRGILNEQHIQRSFGIVQEMIINRQKTVKQLEYLEKCIEKEKEFVASEELELQTLDAMLKIMEIYCETTEDGALCTEETWEKLVGMQANSSNDILKKLDHNELSYSIHKKPIMSAFLVSIDCIQEHQDSIKELKKEEK